jgi:aminoglycoside 3-N-acetyltransferase
VSERETIEAVDKPNTVASLAEQLRDLGAARSEPVIVHPSLRALGWVCGGARAVRCSQPELVDYAVEWMEAHR